MESDTWKVIGYKSNKGKKPCSMGKLYFGDTVDKAEALRRASNIFCFSTVTDVVVTKYTKLDVFIEEVKDMRWLWIPATLVIGGLVLGILFNLMWPAVIGMGLGIWIGISLAPHSPV